MNFVPLALYAAAFVAYGWHFSSRAPAVGRSATAILVAGVLAHTFVIGMETMESGQVPVGDATAYISMFVWLLAVAERPTAGARLEKCQPYATKAAA